MWVSPGQGRDEAAKIFHGARLLIVEDDLPVADALAGALRELGAEVGLVGAHGRGVDLVGSLDPEVVLVEESVTDIDPLRAALMANPRLRFARVLAFRQKEVFPRGKPLQEDTPPDGLFGHRLAALGERISPALAPERALTRAATELSLFEVDLGEVGPVRAVRALAAARSEQVLRLQVRTETRTCAVEVSGDQVVSAQVFQAGGDRLDGLPALARFLELDDGDGKVQQRSVASGSNLAKPVPEALAKALDLLGSAETNRFQALGEDALSTVHRDLSGLAKESAPEVGHDEVTRQVDLADITEQHPSIFDDDTEDDRTMPSIPPPKLLETARRDEAPEETTRRARALGGAAPAAPPKGPPPPSGDLRMPRRIRGGAPKPPLDPRPSPRPKIPEPPPRAPMAGVPQWKPPTPPKKVAKKAAKKPSPPRKPNLAKTPEVAARPSPAPARPSPAPAGPSPAPAGPSPAPARPSPAPAGPSPAPAKAAMKGTLLGMPSQSPAAAAPTASEAKAPPPAPRTPTSEAKAPPPAPPTSEAEAPPAPPTPASEAKAPPTPTSEPKPQAAEHRPFDDEDEPTTQDSLPPAEDSARTPLGSFEPPPASDPPKAPRLTPDPAVGVPGVTAGPSSNPPGITPPSIAPSADEGSGFGARILLPAALVLIAAGVIGWIFVRQAPEPTATPLPVDPAALPSSMAGPSEPEPEPEAESESESESESEPAPEAEAESESEAEAAPEAEAESEAAPEAEAEAEADAESDIPSLMELPAVPVPFLPDARDNGHDRELSERLRHAASEQTGEARLRYLAASAGADRGNPHVMADIAEHYSEAGEHALAEAWAREAVRLRRRRASYRVLLGDVLAAAGKPGPARQAWQQALEIDPDDATAAARLR